MVLYRRGVALASAILASCCFVLTVVSIATDSWVHGEIARSSNGRMFYAGNKTFGLFKGCENKRYGEYSSYRKRCFNSK